MSTSNIGRIEVSSYFMPCRQFSSPDTYITGNWSTRRAREEVSYFNSCRGIVSLMTRTGMLINIDGKDTAPYNDNQLQLEMPDAYHRRAGLLIRRQLILNKQNIRATMAHFDSMKRKHPEILANNYLLKSFSDHVFTYQSDLSKHPNSNVYDGFDGKWAFNYTIDFFIPERELEKMDGEYIEELDLYISYQEFESDSLHPYLEGEAYIERERKEMVSTLGNTENIYIVSNARIPKVLYRKCGELIKTYTGVPDKERRDGLYIDGVYVDSDTQLEQVISEFVEFSDKSQLANYSFYSNINEAISEGNFKSKQEAEIARLKHQIAQLSAESDKAKIQAETIKQNSNIEAEHLKRENMQRQSSLNEAEYDNKMSEMEMKREETREKREAQNEMNKAKINSTNITAVATIASATATIVTVGVTVANSAKASAAAASTAAMATPVAAKAAAFIGGTVAVSSGALLVIGAGIVLTTALGFKWYRDSKKKNE